jgi:acyl carrier protein
MESLHPCPVCGEPALLEVVDPAGAALCANCGALFMWFCSRLGRFAPADRITLYASLARDLGADSLDIVELVMELEQDLGIRIPDVEMEHMDTILDILRYLSKHKDDQKDDKKDGEADSDNADS